MTIWMLIATALIASVSAIMLRQSQPAFATVLTVFVGVAVFYTAIRAGEPLVREITALFDRGEIGRVFSPVLIKALGIGLLTQTAADVCRDTGESALANKVELSGNVLLLLSALPLFEYTLSLLDSIIHGQAVMP